MQSVQAAHSTSLADARRCSGFPSIVLAGLAFDFAFSVEESPVERSGTGGSSKLVDDHRAATDGRSIDFIGRPVA